MTKMLPLREGVLQPGQWQLQMVYSVVIQQPSQHALSRSAECETIRDVWILK